MSAKRSHKPRALGPAWRPVHRRREQGPELQRPVRKSRENEQRGALTREIFASFDRTAAELPDRHSRNNKHELWLRSVRNSFPKWIIPESVRSGHRDWLPLLPVGGGQGSQTFRMPPLQRDRNRGKGQWGNSSAFERIQCYLALQIVTATSDNGGCLVADISSEKTFFDASVSRGKSSERLQLQE